MGKIVFAQAVRFVTLGVFYEKLASGTGHFLDGH